MNELTEGHIEQIHELAEAGHGRNVIADRLNLRSSTVRHVLAGTRVTYSESLSTRERQNLINQGFGGGR